MKLATLSIAVLASIQSILPSAASDARQKRFEEALGNEDARKIAFAIYTSGFREEAARFPLHAIANSFSRRALDSWQVATSGEYSFIEEQLKDFFAGALVMDGPVSQSAALAGLYNPWWDAIMLFEIKRGDSSFIIDECCFMSGETFRGEETKPGEISCRTIVPPDGAPLAIEIMRVVSSTAKAFERMLPDDAPSVWWGDELDAKLSSLNRNVEMERIHMRSLLRAQHLLKLCDNARDTGISVFIERLAQKGSMVRLYKYFRSKASRVLLKSFAGLPGKARASFKIYGYIPAEEAKMFVLVNTAAPRLVAFAKIDAAPSPETSAFEWYDLLYSDDYLAAYDRALLEEVAK